MNFTEVRLKQFKPAIKGLWKIWQEPFFFQVLQVSYKVHEAHCTEEATCKNSRNFRKTSAFSFKKVSIQSKNASCDVDFWGNGPKEIEAKVAGKSFFSSWGHGLKYCNNSEHCSEPAELSMENAKRNVWNI